MSYDDYLNERLTLLMKNKGISFQAKRMFEGIAFMVDDKMCFGINKERLMARVGPDFYEEALTMEGCVPMDFSGKTMKGYVFVQAESLEDEKSLDFWVTKCLEFNPLAKS